MNPADSLLYSLRPALQALVGGKTPAYWQWDLGRICELNFLWQNCAWMDALVSIRLSLKDEPLFGYALQLLTQRDNQPTQVQPELSRPQPSDLTWQKTKLHSAMVLDANGKNVTALERHRIPIPSSPASVRRPVEMLLQQPLRVSQQLLSNLVTLPSRAPNLPYKSLPLPANRSQKWLELSSEVEVPQEGKAVPIDILQNLTYETSLNRITSRTLKYFAPNALTQVASTLTVAGVGTQGNANENRVRLALSTARPLADQWSVPLNGQTASIQLLTRLADPSVVYNNSSNPAAKQKTVSKQELISRSLDLPDSAKAEKNKQNQRLPPVLAESTSTLLLPKEVNQIINNDTAINIGLPTQIDPPVVMSPLPSLLPPQIVNLPPPNVANTIIRQEAKQEETATSEEDLILAAKIKRILDEEARRYGIDV